LTPANVCLSRPRGAEPRAGAILTKGENLHGRHVDPQGAAAGRECQIDTVEIDVVAALSLLDVLGIEFDTAHVSTL